MFARVQACRERTRTARSCLLAFALAACTRGDAARVELRVFAASSLTEAFEAMESAYEAEHPDVDVRLNLSGSQVLRTQIESGARADVFASANEVHMRVLVDAERVGPPETFAGNELVVVVPVNDATIQRFDQLDMAQKIVVGAPEVPAGMYTERVLARAKAAGHATLVSTIRSHVVSREPNVRLVRAKVQLGEADAAFVYRSDAVNAEGLRVIEIPEAFNVRSSYPVALVRASPHPELGKAFVEFLRSGSGQAILHQHGFTSP